MTPELKRKQHLLPESYLNRWVDPATTATNKTPIVWVFSKDGQRREHRSPGQSKFWRDYFYDLFSITGEQNQSIENALGKIEGWTAQITNQKLDQRIPLGRDEVEAIDLFIACMFARTEKFKRSIKNGAEAMARSESERAAAYGLPKPSNATLVQNAHPFSIFTSIEVVSAEIATWTHEMFIAPSGQEFVTSDSPCVWEAMIGLPGLANKSLEISLPLSPRHLLLVSRQPRPNAYQEIPEDLVDYLNWRTICHCDEYFISSGQQTKPIWFEGESFWLKESLKFLTV